VERRTPAVLATCKVIEDALGRSRAYKKIDDDLTIVKQGSAYVMVQVVAWGEDRALVRCVAQMVTGIDMDGQLALKLLSMNSVLRFGTFAYVPEDKVLLFGHSILGGFALDPDALVATVTDVAVIADDWDDRIIAEYGGRTMEDVVTDEALTRIARSLDEVEDAKTSWAEMKVPARLRPENLPPAT